MATITIPNVPQDVHAIYVARAKKAGMSLEAYMRLWLADLAARARIEEIVEEAGRRRAQEQSGREDEG
jgi:plasmid stability protein